MAPQNIPRAISVLTLGNKVILYCIFTYKTITKMTNDYKLPSKHARSNLEECWLWLIVAIMANMQPKSGQTAYAGPNFPHQIRFHSSKEGMHHIVQNQPGSDLDGLVRFWPNAPGLEASQCAIIIIIIMYIYHALIKALSAHMIHINLNMIILYTCRA